jgi:hypothetical protein
MRCSRAFHEDGLRYGAHAFRRIGGLRTHLDFDCPLEQIEVTPRSLAPRTYDVRGCGRHALYTCTERGKKARPRSGETDYAIDCMVE